MNCQDLNAQTSNFPKSLKTIFFYRVENFNTEKLNFRLLPCYFPSFTQVFMGAFRNLYKKNFFSL